MQNIKEACFLAVFCYNLNMSLSIGIVGLPNVRKSTLFKALTNPAPKQVYAKAGLCLWQKEKYLFGDGAGKQVEILCS